MGGRKILLLLNNQEKATDCAHFVSHLFSDHKLLLVIGFVDNDESPDARQQMAITEELQRAFGAHPQIRIAIRNRPIFSIDDIERESGYTDLIVMEAGVFQRVFGDEPRETTAITTSDNLDVPIIILPEAARQVEEVLIIFDGLRPSLNAIKQFCQIMDNQCSGLQVTLLELNHHSAQFLPQEEKLLIEYLREHCDNLGIYKVSEESPDQILQLINCSQNAIVVAGTLDSLRTSLGHVPGLSNQLIRQNNLPGFFGAS